MRINQLVKEKRIGILALQETHLTEERAATLNNLFHDSLVVYPSPDPASPNSARGVAFAVNKNVMEIEIGVMHEHIVPGRAASISLRWGARNRIRIVNVYAPNNMCENAEFWELLNARLGRSGEEKPDLLVGDFNVVEAQHDRAPARLDPRTARESLGALKTKLCMTDGWRNTYPDERDFTFMQTGTGSQSRIDRIYVTDELLPKSADWRIDEPGINTDHRLTSVSLANYADPYIGRGRWTIPRAVIVDRLFMDEVVAAGISVMNEIESTSTPEHNVKVIETYTALKNKITCRARQRAKELYAKWEKKIKDLKDKIKMVTADGIDDGMKGKRNRRRSALKDVDAMPKLGNG
ncbi:Endonuclease/exonuclease/phosphatase [Lenzites betulinus]|nr:Endonuclease/exonuclease/phosphatase [Lenzites betulinus]